MKWSFFNRSFIISSLVVPLGAWLKISHSLLAEPFLLLGILSSLFLVVSFFYEVKKSVYMTAREKFMWTASFVFMGWFAAVLYLIRYRKVRTNV